MGTICPYCNIEVDEISIELEDGYCPECGSIINDDDFLAAFEEGDNLFDDIQFDDEDDGFSA